MLCRFSLYFVAFVLGMLCILHKAPHVSGPGAIVIVSD